MEAFLVVVLRRGGMRLVARPLELERIPFLHARQ
jgi:hypothetical protein